MATGHWGPSPGPHPDRTDRPGLQVMSDELYFLEVSSQHKHSQGYYSSLTGRASTALSVPLLPAPHLATRRSRQGEEEEGASRAWPHPESKGSRGVQASQAWNVGHPVTGLPDSLQHTTRSGPFLPALRVHSYLCVLDSMGEAEKCGLQGPPLAGTPKGGGGDRLLGSSAQKGL